MGKLITENSKNFIKDNFPEVSIQETDIEIIFEGRFIINARKENFEIHEAPLLRIIMNKDYPNILPVCYDLSNKINYDHVFQDGSLCVSTLLDLAITLKDSISIQDYIDSKTLDKYDAIDINVYQSNLFHTKMIIKDIELDNYLFNTRESQLTKENKIEITENLRREMIEIYSGMNIYQN